MFENYTLESLQIKVENAAKVLVGIPNFQGQLKATVKPFVPKTVSEYIWARLSMLGVYKDADSHQMLMSTDCAMGDARAVFCENGSPNLPVVRFKRIWSILKETGADTIPESNPQDVGQQSLVEGFKDLTTALRPYGQWKDTELIEAYNEECDGEIIRVLSERSNNRAFVVFKDAEGNSVDVETTLRMLREARRTETPVHFKVGDALRPLHKAGDFPSLWYYESPFSPGKNLVNGYCDKTHQSWEGIDYEVMQFARVAYELKEIGTDSATVRQFINHARTGGMDDLKRDYPYVAAVFDERKQGDDLPNLKKRLSSDDDSDAADPMCPKKKRF